MSRPVELVDDDHLVLLHHVIHVTLEKVWAFRPGFTMVEDGHVALDRKVLHFQEILDSARTPPSVRTTVRLFFVDGVVRFLPAALGINWLIR
jgi:hypothetical protein